MTTLRPTAIAALLSIACVAQATEQLETITVTARKPFTTDERFASTSVLTGPELSAERNLDLADALRNTPSVSVTRTGGLGSTTSVALRGMTSAQTPVFLNGLRLGSATSGAAAWAALPLGFIDRAEIVRGPSATAFGADALGGAVQLFTPVPTGKPLTSISVGSGDQRTREVTAATQQRIGDWSISAGIRHFRTDGIDSTTPAAYGHEPDKDGFKTTAYSVGAARQVGDHALQLFALSLPNEVQYDASKPYANQFKNRQNVFGVNLHGAISPTLSYEVIAGRTTDESTATRASSAAKPDVFDTTRYTVNAAITHTVDVGEVGLTTKFGVENSRETVDSSTRYTTANRRTTALVASETVTYGPHAVLASLRQETAAGNTENVWHAGYAYTINPQYRIRTSYGTAYRLPSFNDLYYPVYGNPDLKAEEAKGGEVALDATYGRANFTLAYFTADVKNLVAFSMVTWLPENINSAKTSGWELSGKYKISTATTLSGQVSTLDATDRDTGKQLRRRPNWIAALNLDTAITSKWSVGASLTRTGAAYDDAPNKRVLDAYTLVNLRTTYAFTPQWNVTASLQNATDETYTTAYGYNSPGRTAYVRLTHSF